MPLQMETDNNDMVAPTADNITNRKRKVSYRHIILDQDLGQ